MFSVTLRDFHPINTWTPDLASQPKDQEPKYLIDLTTGRKYWNDSKDVIRFKCFLLTLGTPIVHSIALLVRVAFKIVEFKKSLKDTTQDVLRMIVTTPATIVGLELAALYGIFIPYDGRKLYASFERAQYGDSLLAPCFRPKFQFQNQHQQLASSKPIQQP